MTPATALDEAFAAVPRARFLPEDQRRFAALDSPLPIGWGQTNSQPSTVRAMLRLLDVAPGQRVLDVGCGSGWTTALLAHLVGPNGAVLGVERVPGLVARAGAALDGLATVSVHQALEGTLGLPSDAPFDRVLVSAGASRFPGELVDQLGDEGVLVVPVAGEMLRARRTPSGPTEPARTEVTRHGGYSFVPLIGG